MLDSDKFSAIICFVVASVAHLVERHLAKVEVAGSSPVTRSKKKDTLLSVSFWPLYPDGQMSSSGGTPSIPRPLARKEPLHGTALQMEPAQPGQTYSDRPDPGRCPGLPPARRLLPQPPGHPVRRRAEGPGPPACLFPGLALPGTAQERGQEQHEHRHRALPHRHPSGCAVCGGCQLSVSLHPGAGPGGGLQRPPAASARSSRPCSTTR